MADSRYITGNSGSRRNVTLKPNTKSSHYSTRTCKVRACKSKNLNPDTGFCIKHARSKFNNDDLYEKCRECSEMVTSIEYGVTCSKCDFWYHTKCVGISQDQYKCMIEDGNRDNPLFHWYCRFCREKCIEAVAKIDLLENQTRNLATDLTKLDQRVDALEAKLSGKVKETVRSQLEQKFDIDRRKFNVIVFNAPESVQSDTDTPWQTDKKKSEDTRFFCKMVNESLDMDIGDGSDYIKDAVRLGSLRNDGKPRLLRITFSSMTIKREVLGKAKLLKRGKYSGIYVNPDLTPEQRKIDADLRKSLKERKENGESQLFIRRGRIESRPCDKSSHTEKVEHSNRSKEMDKQTILTTNDVDLSMPDLEKSKPTSDSDSEDSSSENISLESISSGTLTTEISDNDTEQIKEGDNTTNTTVMDDGNTNIEKENVEQVDDLALLQTGSENTVIVIDGMEDKEETPEKQGDNSNDSTCIADKEAPTELVAISKVNDNNGNIEDMGIVKEKNPLETKSQADPDTSKTTRVTRNKGRNKDNESTTQ